MWHHFIYIFGHSYLFLLLVRAVLSPMICALAHSTFCSPTELIQWIGTRQRWLLLCLLKRCVAPSSSSIFHPSENVRSEHASSASCLFFSSRQAVSSNLQANTASGSTMLHFSFCCVAVQSQLCSLSWKRSCLSLNDRSVNKRRKPNPLPQTRHPVSLIM